MTDREYEKKIAQIKWERDIAITQLKNDYGVGLGGRKNPDVVKVVRCINCKYSRDLQTKFERNFYCKGTVMCCNTGVFNEAVAMWCDDFCSYGEREENENV
mgnify:CR=1 FL=1